MKGVMFAVFKHVQSQFGRRESKWLPFNNHRVDAFCLSNALFKSARDANSHSLTLISFSDTRMTLGSSPNDVDLAILHHFWGQGRHYTRDPQ